MVERKKEFFARRASLIYRLLFEFCLGGCCYSIMEIVWRGGTQPVMFAVGGVCFVLLRTLAGGGRPLWLNCLLGGFLITLVEFAAGCALNLWLHLSVWDYSDEPLNLLGQVCIRYLLLWIALSPLAFRVHAALKQAMLRPARLSLKV